MQLGKQRIHPNFQFATEERKSYIFLMNKKSILLVVLVAFYFNEKASLWGAEGSGYLFTKEIPVGIKSKPGVEATKVRQKIRNATSRFLDLRWINYEGNLELVRPNSNFGFVSIAPNNINAGITFIGHPFAIIDSINGKLLGCYIFNKTGDFKLAIQETKDGVELITDGVK